MIVSSDMRGAVFRSTGWLLTRHANTLGRTAEGWRTNLGKTQ
jgi:hypothetical protein